MRAIESPNIVLELCAKTFVYDWIFASQAYAPLMKDLYLNSHPCEPIVAQRLCAQNRFRVHVHERFWWKFVRYADGCVPIYVKKYT